MAADMAEFLWNKSLNALREAEIELSFQFTLASHFRRIKEAMESKNIKICLLDDTSDICKLLYELIDVLVDCQIFAHQRKAQKKNRILFNFFMDWHFALQRRKSLAKIERELDKMVKDGGIKGDLDKMVKDGEGESRPVGNLPLTFGFDEYMDTIESILFENRSKENGVDFKSIGICGMGGTGKTTFARKVFNSERVSSHFSRKIWICLSGIQRNETDIGVKIFKLVLKDLDYDIDELKADDIAMIEFSQTLQCLLSHERCLIVFDDVWSWHADILATDINLAGVFPRGSNGAVIVTTRLPKVARRIGGENFIHLQSPLEKMECWKIFEHTLKSGLCNEFEIGFEECLRNIEHKVQEEGFKAIGICGLGGARKTMLARKVFDSDASKKFARKIWVSLSGIQKDEKDMRAKILKLVLEGLDYDFNESIRDDLTLIELLGTLKHILSNENYLIVFDDVSRWHADFLAEETKSSGGLPRHSGGAVIVTSRLEQEARRIVGENLIHLQHPDREDCGKIFERFLRYDPAAFDRIKDEIIYKSRGLPLAAKTLGGIFLEKIIKSETS